MFAVITRRLTFLYPKTFATLLFPPPNNCEVLCKGLTSVKSVRFKYLYKQGFQKEVANPGSRYIPPSPLECAEEFISSMLKNKNSLTDEDWEDFKSDLIDRHEHISEENFSSIVMNTLLSSNQLDLSRNFLKYVEKCNIKPNFLTYLKYISLCSRNRKIVGQEHILKMLNKVIEQIDLSPVLDMKRATYLIQGFCATDRWKESFKYLGKLTERRPSYEICDALACAAIRNDDEKLAWEILMNWINKYEFVSDRVIEEFLIVALKMQKISCTESDKYIEKIFKYMQMHDIIISLNVAKLIEQYFLCHRLKWNITYTKVSRKGVCESCSNYLHLLELKNNEFSDLQDAFLHRVIMKSDLYINTNKDEFNSYMKFIDLNKPFHIVVDGLNAAYSSGNMSKKNLSFQLLKTIKRMSGNSRKLLVLGRKHMRSWPGIQQVCRKAKLFFTDNVSEDDPFVIYAALASGPHTLFLSGDLMRDHISRLEDPRLVHLFKRWQLSHQMFIHSESSDLKLIEPLRHSITVQGSMENGWHIPFDDKIILDPYEELNNWLCIELPKKVI